MIEIPESLLKHWLDMVEGLLLLNPSIEKLDLYKSMLGFFQKHKGE